LQNNALTSQLVLFYCQDWNRNVHRKRSEWVKPLVCELLTVEREAECTLRKHCIFSRKKGERMTHRRHHWMLTYPKCCRSHAFLPLRSHLLRIVNTTMTWCTQHELMPL